MNDPKERMTSAQIVSELNDAGITWTSRRELAKKVGVSRQTVSRVLGPADMSREGDGLLREEFEKVWLKNTVANEYDRPRTKLRPRTKMRRGTQANVDETPTPDTDWEGTPIPKSDAAQGPERRMPVAECIRKLNAAGIKWSTPQELADIVGRTSPAVRQSICADDACGLTPNTLNIWIRNSKLPDAQKIRAKRGRPKGSKTRNHLPRGPKLVSAAQARKQLREAGIRWSSTSRDLAKHLGINPQTSIKYFGSRSKRGTGLLQDRLNDVIAHGCQNLGLPAPTGIDSVQSPPARSPDSPKSAKLAPPETAANLTKRLEMRSKRDLAAQLRMEADRLVRDADRLQAEADAIQIQLQ